MVTTKVYLQKSNRKGKKYMVTIGRKTVHFGATGYSDYTKHKDKERLRLYNQRHRDKENWSKSGIKTAGFWAKNILWNKPSLLASIRATQSKYNIRIIRGRPPKSP
jgi:hypothetical protein